MVIRNEVTTHMLSEKVDSWSRC